MMEGTRIKVSETRFNRITVDVSRSGSTRRAAISGYTWIGRPQQARKLPRDPTKVLPSQLSSKGDHAKSAPVRGTQPLGLDLLTGRYLGFNTAP